MSDFGAVIIAIAIFCGLYWGLTSVARSIEMAAIKYEQSTYR